MNPKSHDPDSSNHWEYAPGAQSRDALKAWYRFDFVGGPLHGEVACLPHTRLRLWVALLENGNHVVWRSMTRPDELPGAGTLIGDYAFDHAHDAMLWIPIVRDMEVST